ncbi:hypothetical protein, partial [Vibrio anguillarum]|uniref:hypothetical protein n=1 Tax=Vibrio anguillarum TaxID=55601 RepID=UPI001BE47A3D
VKGGRKTWQYPVSATLAVMTRIENRFTIEARNIICIMRNLFLSLNSNIMMITTYMDLLKSPVYETGL